MNKVVRFLFPTKRWADLIPATQKMKTFSESIKKQQGSIPPRKKWKHNLISKRIFNFWNIWEESPLLLTKASGNKIHQRKMLSRKSKKPKEAKWKTLDFLEAICKWVQVFRTKRGMEKIYSLKSGSPVRMHKHLSQQPSASIALWRQTKFLQITQLDS